MSNALISVIIPVYNVENYLRECLDSVLNQTYKNVQIITINDGSSDRSLDILRSYASKFNNIEIINQNNSGQSVARNKGLELAKGKYIYFLDSDDYILPEAFEKLIDQLEKNNLDLIRFAAQPFSDDFIKNIDYKEYDFQDHFESQKNYNKIEFLSRNLKAFSPSPVLYIVKKEILFDNNILFYPGIIHEDELFTLEVFLNINRMMYDSNFYYQRRFRNNSTMTSQYNIERSFNSYAVVLKKTMDLLNQYIDKYEKKLIKSRIYKLTGRLIYNNNIAWEYKRNQLKELGIMSSPLTIFFILKRGIKKLFN